MRHFADPTSGLCDWINPPQQVPPREIEVDGETLVERQQRLSLRNRRLLETYQQERRDWAWEISRSFARCCHMLTAHADAYANECFLGTATQWEHVRRLVGMLDYHPAPPASASTWLAFSAKPGKAGVIAKGFQVKNSPPAGASKVIFETLQDIAIDAALNELRPLGWNHSGEPLGGAPAGDGEVVSVEVAEVMLDPAIALQGVGAVHAAALDALKPADGFRIFDFLSFDPATSALGIAATLLWEWKAKAYFLNQFTSPGDWSGLLESTLGEITALSSTELATQSGNTVDQAAALQQALRMVEVCLDHPHFVALRLRKLIGAQASVAASNSTLWIMPAKPAVEAGEVAMLIDDAHHRANAVTIDRVETIDGKPPTLALELGDSPLQNEWHGWASGDTRLHYAPRWQRKCWLNGANVIRTAAPHGLAANAYVGWRRSGQWRYAKIIEADTRNLRLQTTSPLPLPGDRLYSLSPISGTRAGANLEVVVLLDGDNPGGAVPAPAEAVAMDTTGTSDIFTITKELPEVSIPTETPFPLPGALPGIGSFLFPSPFLPIDLVKAAIELMLSLGLMMIPSSGKFVIKGFPPTDLATAISLNDATDKLYVLLDNMKAGSDEDSEPMVVWQLPTEAERKEALRELLVNAAQGDTPLFQEIREDLELQGPMLAIAEGASELARVVASDPRYMFDGAADRIRQGDWVVAEFSNGPCALAIDAIETFVAADKAESFALYLVDAPHDSGGLIRVQADFRGQLVAENANFNPAPIDPDNFMLELLPEALTIGRSLLVTGCGNPYLVSITDMVDGRITFEPRLQPCIAGNMVLLGNVAPAGHGESQPQKIFGSGDAAQSGQAFTIEVSGVSFTPDATQAAGVAADIEVKVAGRVWQQVSTLRDSVSDDRHYELRMTEDGYVRVIFGDGVNGRRLPSGSNNLRLRYRVGNGLAGNLPPYNLDKAINPNPLVDTVSQPMPASGGGDMEALSSLRENAPPTLLALERAVSLSDFAHLASARSDVWQARAYREVDQGGRMERITVIVVPAGGILTDDLRDTVESHLGRHSLPGITVSVESYTPRLVDMRITLRVDSSAWLPREVAAAVEAELKRVFALQQRGLGQPLYLSEIYKAVEGIDGVENSICVLDDNARVVRPADRNQVVHLDVAAGSTLLVGTKEYRP
ncbi:MAG: baseplate J/gp47 family protein [Candidatus Accumulibacter meliphilus]|uniref:baseplate J/gp47 family protein n=1 Tax=Candidatus Accumulibacter meliphilus TaxID=2211374 RepID=UPI002FC38FA7